MEPFSLQVWRLHPKGVRIEKAEKTLNGTAHPDGVKFCRPYSSVNALGWWLYPAVDVDIMWKGGREFEHNLHEPWPHTEHEIVKSLVKDSDNVDVDSFAPIEGRSKFTWGGVENSVAQFWTGCIFKTPPGWCLQIRSPINCTNPDYTVMEGILETDWMQYDIWINLVFKTPNKWIEFRKNNWPPIAQLVPIRRESVDADWQITTDEVVNRDSTEANQVFEYWLQYNQKKFACGGKQRLSETRTKDSTTFWKERQEHVNKDTFEPNPTEPKPINKKKIPNFGMKKKCPYSSQPEE